MFRRKRDIAPQADIEGSSTYCDETGCYDLSNMVDGDRSEDSSSTTSWVSEDADGGSVEFRWRRPYRGMEQIYFIGSSSHRVREYTIEIDTFSGWKTVAQVSGNTGDSRFGGTVSATFGF